MRLVDFHTADGLRCDGLFVPPTSDAVVVHVHGKCGNFYQNDFLKPMFQLFEQAGIGFLAFNNRGHDCIAEGYRNGLVEYVGGSMERFEDCLLDIDAAILFAREHSSQVVVQGHSNGCEKTLLYALSRPEDINGVVLLSPSDSYEMQRLYRPGELPDDQLRRLIATSEEDEFTLLASDEYGIRTGDKEYPIPVSRSSMLDLLDGPALQVLRLSRAWEAKPAGIPSLVCLGEHDPYLTVESAQMAKQVEARLGEDMTFELFADTDHHFHGKERAVARTVAGWVSELLESDRSAQIGSIGN